MSQLGYATVSSAQPVSMFSIPAKRNNVNIHNRAQMQAASANNASRKTSNALLSKEAEHFQEEIMRLKQLNNSNKEENVKLKTKIKILESENARKERTIEDFYTQSQFIVNAQKHQ